jgi:hypothetical protein
LSEFHSVSAAASKWQDIELAVSAAASKWQDIELAVSAAASKWQDIELATVSQRACWTSLAGALRVRALGLKPAKLERRGVVGTALDLSCGEDDIVTGPLPTL